MSDSSYLSLRKIANTPRNPQKVELLYTGVLGAMIILFMDFHQELMYVIIFLLLLKSILNKQQVSDYTSFTILVMIGFSLFFLIWEGRSRYILPSVQPLLLLAGIGLVQL
ncbi:MAG: hypothetical protein ACRC6X_04770 [Culicoidibacterales bacterium]